MCAFPGEEPKRGKQSITIQPLDKGVRASDPATTKNRNDRPNRPGFDHPAAAMAAGLVPTVRMRGRRGERFRG